MSEEVKTENNEVLEALKSLTSQIEALTPKETMLTGFESLVQPEETLADKVKGLSLNELKKLQKNL